LIAAPISWVPDFFCFDLEGWPALPLPIELGLPLFDSSLNIIPRVIFHGLPGRLLLLFCHFESPFLQSLSKDTLQAPVPLFVYVWLSPRLFPFPLCNFFLPCYVIFVVEGFLLFFRVFFLQNTCCFLAFIGFRCGAGFCGPVLQFWVSRMAATARLFSPVTFLSFPFFG